MTSRFSGTRPVDASYHHGDHRHLLIDVSVDEVDGVDLDALIVPAARPEAWLRESMALAGGLGCGVVALCSHRIDAAEAADLGDRFGVPVIAVDIAKCGPVLPAQTSIQLLNRYERFRRKANMGTKRNMGLLLARIAGWRRVLFLDDDIYDLAPAHARAAAGLLDRFDVVGMHNRGYPDNSVVCHVNRIFGDLQPGLVAQQREFIGAGAMAVAPMRTRSFFPEIYNEDWLFILGHGRQPNVAVVGQMAQRVYDPFANPSRARREELGDCLAEGLFWLLDNRLPIANASIEHWHDFLSRRLYFIEVLIRWLNKLDVDAANRQRMRTSLEAAWQTCVHISAGMCDDLVERWTADLDRWRSFIDLQPMGLGVGKALEYLSWSGVELSKTPWSTYEDRLPYRDGWDGQISPAAKPDADSPWSALPSQFTQRPARRRAVR